jgi:hypothetical protein
MKNHRPGMPIAITRIDLYRQVWSTPLIQLAARYQAHFNGQCLDQKRALQKGVSASLTAFVAKGFSHPDIFTDHLFARAKAPGLSMVPGGQNCPTRRELKHCS